VQQLLRRFASLLAARRPHRTGMRQAAPRCDPFCMCPWIKPMRASSPHVVSAASAGWTVCWTRNGAGIKWRAGGQVQGGSRSQAHFLVIAAVPITLPNQSW